MDQVFDVSSKKIVITGAAGLIGTEISKCLAQRKAEMILIDTNKSQLDKLKGSIENSDYYLCDVSDTKELEETHRKIMDKHAHIDVLINAHQYKPRGFLEEKIENFPDELWDQIIGVNLTGTFKMCKIFSRSMLKRIRINN